MARIEIDKITKIDKSIHEHDVVRATYSVASTGENDCVFQIDTYSGSEQGDITQTLQLNEDNLGKLMKLISSEFKSFSIPLLDDKGEVKYGINWGNRANRNINQAYLDLPIDIYNSDFFPTNGNRFVIRTDDNQDLTFTRAQKDNINGHALQTPDDNSIIGLYLRRRLSIEPGEIITKEAIEAYGRNHITISKIGEFYYLDFSTSNAKKIVTKDKSDVPLQQIFYGAPGTGKSYQIDKDTNENNRIRTTFHPDYDYATFVGCYKPTKESTDKKLNTNLSFQDLANILNGYYNDPNIGNILGLQKFVYEYHPYLNGDIMSVNVTQLLQQAGVSTSYNVEINKYVKFCKMLPQKEESKITYSFVPQSFTKAYVEAWRRFTNPECTDKNYYLVIEEINRGNCAQIFGDLFQLLDRTRGGYSSYAVEADTDLQQFLATDNEWKLNITLTKDIENDEGRIIAKAKDVMSGKVLVLPPNLHIWATMNTSDQSLFPIDSAFKRRWDWTYVPIKYENTEWKVVLSDNSWCSWTELQTTLNDLIYDATESEDKMLGDWFVKADKKNEITEEQLVGKIIFYLWNDVAKVDAGTLFDLEVAEKRGKNKRVTFSDFYKMDGKTNTTIVKEWLTKIGISINEPKVDPETTVGTDTSASVPTKPEYQRLFDVLKAKCEANGIKYKSFSNSINMAIGEYAFSKLMIAVALDSTGTPSADIKLWIEGTPKAIATRDTLRSNGAGAFFEELAQESDKLSWEEIAKDVPETESKVRGWRLHTTAITFDEANVAEEAEWIFAKAQQIRKRFANVL